MKVYKGNRGYTCFEIDIWDGSNWCPGREFFDLIDMKAGIQFLLPTKTLGQLVTITAHLLREGGNKVETPEDLAKLLERGY